MCGFDPLVTVMRHLSHSHFYPAWNIMWAPPPPHTLLCLQPLVFFINNKKRMQAWHHARSPVDVFVGAVQDK